MGRGRVAWHDGRPAGVMGFFEPWTGQWEAVSFGTDAFASVAGSLMRYARREMGSILVECGARRLQAASHEGNADGHRFIEALGGRLETTLEAYGKGGDDYRLYVWLASSYAHLVQRAA